MVWFVGQEMRLQILAAGKDGELEPVEGGGCEVAGILV